MFGISAGFILAMLVIASALPKPTISQPRAIRRGRAWAFILLSISSWAICGVIAATWAGLLFGLNKFADNVNDIRWGTGLLIMSCIAPFGMAALVLQTTLYNYRWHVWILCGRGRDG